MVAMQPEAYTVGTSSSGTETRPAIVSATAVPASSAPRVWRRNEYPSATRQGAARDAMSADAAFGALEIPSTNASPSAAPIATTSTGRP